MPEEKIEEKENVPVVKADNAPAVKADNAPAVKADNAPAVKADNAPAVKKDTPPAVKADNSPMLKSGNPPARRIRKGTAADKEALGGKPARTEKKPAAKKGGVKNKKYPSKGQQKPTAKSDLKLDSGPTPSLGDMLGEELKKKLAAKLKK